MRSTSIVRSLFQQESGSMMVETAASATLLIMVLFGTMESARALYVDNFVSNSAREAVRYAMVRGGGWNGTTCASASSTNCTATAANIAAYIQSLAPLGVSTSPTQLSVSTSWPGTSPSGTNCTAGGSANSPGCVVQVHVSYAFNFVIPFMPKDTLLLTASSAMAISQ